MRKFNVTGLCVPSKHYMVDISQKLDRIIELIENGHYFTINRARQYGKTTTLSLLEKRLTCDYLCVNISFEDVSGEDFETSGAFCSMFLEKVSKACEFTTATKKYAREWLNEDISNIRSLSKHITKMCKDKKIVLLIDEADKSTHNRTLIHFLSMLRAKYLAAQDNKDYTFHSVILAGVVDIKNMKLKMINDGIYKPIETEDRIFNSPWNIAADFDVSMSFNPMEISSMLFEYEADHQTGMDIELMADEIYKYTSGYPFLVAWVCKCIEEKLSRNWTKKGIQEAVKIILQDENVLFDDMTKNLENNTDMYDFLYSMLIVGERKSFVTDNPVVKWSSMFGYIKRSEGISNGSGTGYAVISNKIFEMRMSYYFVSKDENASRMESALCQGSYHEIVKDGTFDMPLCLQKFADHYKEMFAELDEPFLERHGRLLFLSYLKPLVNGLGFYHIESQFTDLRRMDIVVDFGCEQFIIELKLWKGEVSKEKSYEQLSNYMETKNTDKGYLLTFDFRKEANKERKAEWVGFGDKMIFDVMV